MYRVLYMAVTTDKYELPLFVGTSKEMCEWAGITINTLNWYVRKAKRGESIGRLSGRKFVTVKDE